MRHSLAQLLASSSACPSPSKGPPHARSGSRAEAGDEAAPPRREDSDDSSSLEEAGGAEPLFPAGLELELDDWLEAAVVATENRPGWLSSPERACAETEEEQPKQQQQQQRPQQGRRPARPAGSSRLKAAAAARLNRQRKKQYVMGLESRLQGLAAENRGLRDRNRGLCRRLRDLERETSYLRAVLANQSALGRLLSRLAGDGRVGLRISSSGLVEDGAAAAAVLEARPAYEASGDHDYALPVVPEGGERKRAASPSAGGICLHVDRDQVSVEFCSACARRAAVGSALGAAAASPPSTADSYSYSTLASKIFSFRWLPCQAPLCRG
ncbi:CREB/ATF bZIP transcription factor [Podarcis raffonei]|uniref:CREB/ATF bZIP transcription factor n=1 Tax=Podarcis raffonei TaxID=65483 RepID=UPI00232915A3|nr:CREB/ATF bZIP transcription factor [Podarcis raffonei]